MPLTVSGLSVGFKTENGVFKALNGLSYVLEKGKTLAVVGESGSGKTVGALALTGLLQSPPAFIEEGSARLNGNDLLKLKPSALRLTAGKQISYVFQEPSSALNPVLTIGEQIEEPLKIHTSLNAKDRKEKVLDMLKKVGISEPEKNYYAYPHQFSGGMKQRVCIAMALICDPEFLIADEPTTALDVTTQAQVFSLIKELQAGSGMGVMLITHSLLAAAHLADDALVLYAGEVMEYGPKNIVLEKHLHPYTEGLFNSQPPLDKKPQRLLSVNGQPGEKPAKGCVFSLRCPKVFARCREEKPALLNKEKHFIKCHLYENEYADRS